MTTKKANITIEEYIEMSEVDFNEAVNYEFTSDTCQLANSIYQSLYFFDIYLDHVAKYAYEQKVNNIKEYYPLKRAILHQENALYFRFFSNFDDFLEKNYLKTIWQVSKETPFSEMDFNMFKNISEKIIFERGSKMLNDLKSNYKK
ncbi:hypothetical protein [Streptococcus pneumoniae]|uniref:hypothetical protein n=1 Tax=Streptococcus pneumoniae TaxID=1313 RepID=UPI00076929AF|nr:hypothetical protein [Streptococcus pneumoniae]VMW39989.1 Uncharacterised protein [Streptococcus pneumoniae]HEV9816199.1 hypothetical protein [Streptococcus pneumoniae]HEX1189560.1 hypothetical protein [Streptococcus pneumoniae]